MKRLLAVLRLFSLFLSNLGLTNSKKMSTLPPEQSLLKVRKDTHSDMAVYHLEFLAGKGHQDTAGFQEWCNSV